MNRLTLEEVRDSSNLLISSYTYTLRPDGLRTQVLEHQKETGGGGGGTFSDVKVSYEYDADGRLTREFRDVSRGKDSQGKPVFSATGLPDSVGDYADTYAFDLSGNRLSKRELKYSPDYPMIPAAEGVTSYAYNERDELTSETYKPSDFVDAMYLTIVLGDGLGEQVAVRGNDGLYRGGTTQAGYTIGMHVAGGRFYADFGDEAGGVWGTLNFTDPAHGTFTIEGIDTGDGTRTWLADAFDGASFTYSNPAAANTTYTYDANGSQTSRTTPDGTTTYTWNLRNLMTGIDADGSPPRPSPATYRSSTTPAACESPRPRPVRTWPPTPPPT